MSYIDIYDPKAGGFRATLAYDWTTSLNTLLPVGLDGNGRVIPFTSSNKANIISECVGLAIVSDDTGQGQSSLKAGSAIDVLTNAVVAGGFGAVAVGHWGYVPKIGAGTPFTGFTQLIDSATADAAADSSVYIPVGFRIAGNKFVVRLGQTNPYPAS